MRKLLLLLLLTLVPSTLLANDEFVAVAAGIAPCPVVYAKDGPKRDQQSAIALGRYLTRISGADFPVRAVTEAPTDRAILVGGIAGELEAAGGDAFRIEVTATQLRLTGRTPQGTAMAVYSLLEEELGCTFWSADEEIVPEQTEIRLPLLDRRVESAFWQADIMNREARSNQGDFGYKSRTINAEGFLGNHNLYTYLTPVATAENEFYPYSTKTKKRAPNKLHFCYTAPGIAEALAAAISVEVEKRHGQVRDIIYQAGMGDWYGGYCECERCQAVYVEEKWTRPDGVVRGAPAATLIRMINRTAEILDAKYPGIRVGTFAYMSLEGPPGKTVPRDNVVIWLPHLRHCIIHAVDACDKNDAFEANLRRWCELAPGRVYIWDYAANYGENFLYPFPVITSMSQNIRLYRELGVRGIRLQGNYVSTGGDLAVLKNWVWSRLLRDADAEPTALIRTFCEGYYGAAAPELIEYVTTLERRATESPVHVNEFGKLAHLRKAYLDTETEAALQALLGRALAKVQTLEPYDRRVREAMVSLQAVRLWHAGPLTVTDTSYIRTDLGPEPSWPQVEEMLAFSREGGAKEWIHYRSYHSQVRVMHGGPIATLRDGPLAVQVAPWLRGRIRSIRFHDRELLRIPGAKEKGYPNLGGAYEMTNPGYYSLDHVVSQSDRQVVLEGGAGGSTVRHTARQEITVAGPDRLEISAWSQRHHSDAEASTAIHLEFAVGAGDDALAAAVGDGETWQDVTFAPPTAEQPAHVAVIESTGTLRLTLPQLGCTVTDQLVSPAAAKIRLEHNRTSGVLNVTIVAGSVPLSNTEMTLRAQHTLTFSALPPTPPPAQEPAP